MTNERFEELVHNLLAYDEARNVLKLSDVERDEFQNVIESRLHPTKLEMGTPRGKLVLEKDEDTLSTYIGLESNISGEFIDVAQVNYLNPDNSKFQRAVNSDIYVDKTGLIKYTNRVINTMQAYVCVSRPRRFGKSMAMDMLSAYYERNINTEKLFGNLEISRRCIIGTLKNKIPTDFCGGRTYTCIKEKTVRIEVIVFRYMIAERKIFTNF